MGKIEAQRKYSKTAKGRATQRRADIKRGATEERRAKRREYAREWRKNNREKYLAQKKKRYYEDKEYLNLKRLAAMHGTEFGVLKEVRKRDKICQLCGSEENLQFDHIYPVKLGGQGTLENLQLLCQSCNLFKSGNKLLLAGNFGVMIL